jgi:hypothetical protein
MQRTKQKKCDTRRSHPVTLLLKNYLVLKILLAATNDKQDLVGLYRFSAERSDYNGYGYT